MNSLKNAFQEIMRYPSAVFGVIIIALLVIEAAYAMITIPYNEAIRLWRGGEEVWYQNQKFAPPAWMNYFTAKKQPVSFAVQSTDGELKKVVTPGAEGTSTIEMTYTFDYSYDDFPQEMLLFRDTYRDASEEIRRASKESMDSLKALQNSLINVSDTIIKAVEPNGAR